MGECLPPGSKGRHLSKKTSEVCVLAQSVGQGPGQEGTLLIIRSLKPQAQSVILTFHQYGMMAVDRLALTLRGFI